MITRKDIALTAGVSVSVVSRALNNSGYVDKEKKAEIIRLAEEMGYRVNPVAISLATRKTRQLLFFCPELENAFNIELYEGMVAEARRQGYMVVIQSDVEFNHVKNLMVDGVVFPNPYLAECFLEQEGKNYVLPAVCATFGNTRCFKRCIPVVDCDAMTAMNLAIKYLRKKGHRKIAAAMPYSLRNPEVRITAWKDYVRTCDVMKDVQSYFFGADDEDPTGMLNSPERFFEKGMEAGEKFAERRCDATAVVCFNDELALGFYKSIRGHGYSVPEDLSIVSIDAVFCRQYCDVEITSVSLNAKEIGSACVDLLLRHINGDRPKYVLNVKPKLMEGKSVKEIG
ncbi:MAG: LacI family transcriptional regulator [Lachnospiraceae bacterium]|nr:LacI family transcriptional regulator [Lachnospiraceae bacterium]